MTIIETPKAKRAPLRPSAVIRELQVTAATHVGRVRKVNQDRVLVGDWSSGADQDWLHQRYAPLGVTPFICAVADGLGGHAAGEIASAQVLASLLADRGALDGRAAIGQAISRADAGLHDQIDRTGHWGMGTTVAGLVVLADRVWWFNVGDSRIYQLGVDGQPRQVSVDDRSDPEISAFFGLGRSELSASLGGGDRPGGLQPHIGCAPFDRPSRWLLCSDGLSDLIEPGDLRFCLEQEDQLAVQLLVEAALDAEGSDNISVVLASIP